MKKKTRIIGITALVMVVAGALLSLVDPGRAKGPVQIPTADWFADHKSARKATIDACVNDPSRMANVQLACENARLAETR